MSHRIATAEWAHPEDVAGRLSHRPGTFWLGRTLNPEGTPVGYNDDRHICLVSGTRGGKGTTTIIPNLCLWPGSVVVVDPKGENASVTAARRGPGSEHAEGMGQTVHVLDPYKTAKVDDRLRSRFNPLDALDPEGAHCVRNAERIAAALVPPSKAEEKFWENGARRLISGLILHVLTAPEYEGRRSLVTVRELVFRGDVETARLLREDGYENIPSGHNLLWAGMIENEAFGGYVAGIGERYESQMLNAPKQWEGILDEAVNATGFINNPGMQACLSASDFSLSDLKTDPNGVSLYLSIPQRFMTEDFRWLRMMIALITTEMEAVSGPPATGHRILMFLDEFAGLKRMEVIENAIAQMAGYGLKMFVVLQDLTQLKKHYEHSWQTFLGNSGLKIFYAVEDQFTREYVSKLVGETERIREVRSTNESVGHSESRSSTETDGWSRGQTRSESESLSHSSSRSESISSSDSYSRSNSRSTSHTRGRNSSRSKTNGRSAGRTYRGGLFYSEISRSEGRSGSSSESSGESESWTNGTTDGDTWGQTSGHTSGSTWGETRGRSSTRGTSTTESSSTSRGITHGQSRNVGRGASETVHRVPLIAPHEVGLRFARVDNPDDGRYPGLALVLASGYSPIVVRKTPYFEDGAFYRLYDPHPDYEHLLAPWQVHSLPPPPRPYLDYLRLDGNVNALAYTQPDSLIEKGYPYIGLQVAGTGKEYRLLSPVNGHVHSVMSGKLPQVGQIAPCTDDPKNGQDASNLVVATQDLGADILTREELDEDILAMNRETLEGACLDKRHYFENQLSAYRKEDYTPFLTAAVLLTIGIVGSFVSGLFHIATALAWASAIAGASQRSSKPSKKYYWLPAVLIVPSIANWLWLILALIAAVGILYEMSERGEKRKHEVRQANRPIKKKIQQCPV